MTERIYLHVGAPKSGTTYLQKVLEKNRELLASAGVLVVGERHVDRVHAGLAVRQDPRLEQLPAAASQAWKRLTAEVRAWPGPVAVLSYELLAGASAEQVEAALADLEGLEIHVVITSRDLGRAVPSAWQERLKFALTTPLESWVPRPESDGPRAEWGWRTMDPSGVAARWGAALPPGRVHVVTMPRQQDVTGELWHRFAQACGIDDVEVDVAVERSNESLGTSAAEVLRRVNERLPAELDNNREQARWLRDVLAHQVLADLDAEPMGITDTQYSDAAERSEHAVSAIAEAGYHVVGDLDDIRATRREARTPGQVDDAELLRVALDAMVRLLLLLREQSRRTERERPAPQPDEPRGPRATVRRLLRAATVQRVDAELEQARAEIRAIEEELKQSRDLQLKVAELDDLVAELLLPPNHRNAVAMAQALRRYRAVSL